MDEATVQMDEKDNCRLTLVCKNESHSASNLSNSRLTETCKKIRIDFKALDKKRKERSGNLHRRRLLAENRRQMNAFAPSVQQLLEADRKMCMEKTFDKVILDYNTLSYNGLYDESLLDQDLDESFTEEAEELFELFQSSSNFIKYENAIFKLLNGNVTAAKRILLDLVNDFVQPAYYAYVLVFFKEEIIKQCDILNTTEENAQVMENNKDELKDAVRLLARANLMEPANSFLLGMVKRYNIGECSQFMKGPWEEDLISVVNVARYYHFLNIDQYILQYIDPINRWENKRCGLGMQKKSECLKEMGNYALYEITLSMASEEDCNARVLNKLFQILLRDEFPDALYSYGAALLQTKVGKKLVENIKEAMESLDRAASAGHEGAKFLLGILPFKNKVSYILKQNEIKCCIRRLENYIESSDGSCTINEQNIDKLAHCLAVEYYAEWSLLVEHDKQKAVELLESRKLYKELHDLQYKV